MLRVTEQVGALACMCYWYACVCVASVSFRTHAMGEVVRETPARFSLSNDTYLIVRCVGCMSDISLREMHAAIRAYACFVTGPFGAMNVECQPCVWTSGKSHDITDITIFMFLELEGLSNSISQFFQFDFLHQSHWITNKVLR